MRVVVACFELSLKLYLPLYTSLARHMSIFSFMFVLAEMPGVARVEISKPAIVGRLEVSPATLDRRLE
jgi:hypothetical protein